MFSDGFTVEQKRFGVECRDMICGMFPNDGKLYP